jgi:hypothetical protein
MITVKKQGSFSWIFDTIDQRPGQSLDVTYADYGKRTYKVCVLSSSASTLNCTVRQHRDICPSSISLAVGALWTHEDGGNQNGLSGVVTYHEIVWYVPQSRVSILVDFISSDEYLTTMDNLLAGTFGITTWATSYFPYKPVAVVAGIINALLAISAYSGGVLDFQQDYIDEIRSCGDFTGTGTVSTYGNGVKLSTLKDAGVGSTGTTTFDVESWYGTPMVGPVGEIGAWLANES